MFVIEAVDTMNEQAANRLLKTLEEPPAFAHLLLLTDRREDVLRDDRLALPARALRPAAARAIARGPAAEADHERAHACARLALGDAGRARDAGERAGARRCGRPREGYVRSALAGDDRRAPRGASCSSAAQRRRARARRAGAGADREELELVPGKERKALRTRRRWTPGAGASGARARGRSDQALRLAELWLRDVLCVVRGRPRAVHAVDRRAELSADAAACTARALRAQAIELVREHAHEPAR